jgi:hypothetical protein
MIVKHWREDWTYENLIFSSIRATGMNQRSPTDQVGKWTQTVWEVSDAPRYQEHEWINKTEKPSGRIQPMRPYRAASTQPVVIILC